MPTLREEVKAKPFVAVHACPPCASRSSECSRRRVRTSALRVRTLGFSCRRLCATRAKGGEGTRAAKGGEALRGMWGEGDEFCQNIYFTFREVGML